MRNIVSSEYPNSEKRAENTTHSIFDKIWDVWRVDERLSRMFDLSSQLKQKLKSKQGIKIVKIYAN